MMKPEDDRIEVNSDDSGERKKPAKKKAEPKQASKEDQYLEQLQRLQAEFTNYRRRVEKEWKEVAVMAKADMALKFISVIDDLERVIVHHETDAMIETEGVKMILQKCRKLLSDEGVEVIDAVGEVFDPERHAAVTVENVDEERDDIVLEEWQKGYVIGDRLLRPSQVKVGRYQSESGE
ncbi:nucleotide exchange factor GrpE [bacterium]|nr:nucleotide exchange factor GrpE [bacterium]